MKKISFFQLFINCIKEARETKRNLKKLQHLELSIDALQQIVNTVALGAPVEIDIKTFDGNIITIKRSEGADIGYTSFRDKYEKAKANRTTFVQ